VKRSLPILAALVVGILAGFLLSPKSCGLGSKYWMRVAVHEQAMKDAAAAHAGSLAEIRDLEADNAAKEEDLRVKIAEIKTIKGQSAAAAGELSMLAAERDRLKRDAQAAIDANPALQALIANFELSETKHREYEHSLELRLAKVGEPYEIGEVDEAGRPIVRYPVGTVTGDLWQLIVNERKRGDLWEADYNRSQGLLKTEKSLRLDAEKKAGAGKFWKAVAVIEPVVFGAITIFGK